nr:hypothetical protein CFP56_29642 [Quercus suber]
MGFNLLQAKLLALWKPARRLDCDPNSPRTDVGPSGEVHETVKRSCMKVHMVRREWTSKELEGRRTRAQ